MSACMQGKVISGNQRDTDHAHLEQLAHHVGAIELVGHLMREAIRRSLEVIRGHQRQSLEVISGS